ncbi:MAG: hypothetical protein H0T92_07105 [Pyrinomonadaceae bacterium]|nr:hypothetical protein [Pyrinomonadaceae bacterium]
MMKKSWLAYLTLSGAVLSISCAFVGAIQPQQGQEAARSESACCENNRYSVHRRGRQLASHCEVKEQTLQPAAGGTISVDGRQNGGVRINGWERGDILVRACIQTAADTEAEARELAAQLRVQTTGAQIRAEGPENSEDRSWSVSFEVFVPHESNLSLQTHNGGIRIDDVRGQIKFAASNGGVSLKALGGSVRGSTTNGGLSIDLAGNSWNGEGLDVRATNGGVKMSVPENYSARLETGTVNGGLQVDFPVTVQGRINKELSFTLGSGGSMVRALTTNGGVVIKRKAAE